MGWELYFRYEIDRNPVASDTGTIKACVNLVTPRDGEADSVQTWSITWLADDFMEDEGISSTEELNDLWIEAGFRYEHTLFTLTDEVNRRITELITSSGDYTSDCALYLSLTFRLGLSPLYFPLFEEDDEINNNIQPRPARKLVVESLSRKIYKKTGSLVPDECTICLQEFKNGSKLVTLDCGHDFDEECIVKWFDKNHVCPLCRFQLPPGDQ